MGSQKKTYKGKKESEREPEREEIKQETNSGEKLPKNFEKIKKTAEPSGPLAAAIDRDFGSLDEFKKEFSTAGATQFGSGWAWLVLEKGSGKLLVKKTGNAETPLTDEGVVPILTMDGAFVFSLLCLFCSSLCLVADGGREGGREMSQERERREIERRNVFFSLLSLTFSAASKKPETKTPPKPKKTVWEHAYYPVYENRRPEYIGVFVNELINWDKVGERFAAAGGK